MKASRRSRRMCLWHSSRATSWKTASLKSARGMFLCSLDVSVFITALVVFYYLNSMMINFWPDLYWEEGKLLNLYWGFIVLYCIARSMMITIFCCPDHSVWMTATCFSLVSEHCAVLYTEWHIVYLLLIQASTHSEVHHLVDTFLDSMRQCTPAPRAASSARSFWKRSTFASLISAWYGFI